MPDIIQQLLDLKEWSQDSARYERRLNFRYGSRGILGSKGPGEQIQADKKINEFFERRIQERIDEGIRQSPEGVLMPPPDRSQLNKLRDKMRRREDDYPPPADWRLNPNYVEYDDGTIYYKDTGEYYLEDGTQVVGPSKGAKPIPETLEAREGPIPETLEAREGGRIGYDQGGQLVQPGPGRQGYEGKDIGVAGGEAGAKKRIVLGLKPHEVTVYRRLVTERATKRGIQAPNWDTHPGRGFSSDNLQGQNIAKDIKRRLVGSRKGSVIGSGSGGTELFLSKVDQDKIIKRFGDNLITVPTDTGTGTKIVKLKDGINFKKKGKIYGTKYGVLFTKKDGANYKMGQKISNYIRGQHGPNFAFDAFDSANYHLKNHDQDVYPS